MIETEAGTAVETEDGQALVIEGAVVVVTVTPAHGAFGFGFGR